MGGNRPETGNEAPALSFKPPTPKPEVREGTKLLCEGPAPQPGEITERGAAPATPEDMKGWVKRLTERGSNPDEVTLSLQNLLGTHAPDSAEGQKQRKEAWICVHYFRTQNPAKLKDSVLPKVVELFLTMGTDPTGKDVENRDLFFAAVKANDTLLVENILKYAEDPKLTELLSQKDGTTEDTPLMLAIASGNLKMVEAMLAKRITDSESARRALFLAVNKRGEGALQIALARFRAPGGDDRRAILKAVLSALPNASAEPAEGSLEKDLVDMVNRRLPNLAQINPLLLVAGDLELYILMKSKGASDKIEGGVVDPMLKKVNRVATSKQGADGAVKTVTNKVRAVDTTRGTIGETRASANTEAEATTRVAQEKKQALDRAETADREAAEALTRATEAESTAFTAYDTAQTRLRERVKDAEDKEAAIKAILDDEEDTVGIAYKRAKAAYEEAQRTTQTRRTAREQAATALATAKTEFDPFKSVTETVDTAKAALTILTDGDGTNSLAGIGDALAKAREVVESAASMVTLDLDAANLDKIDEAVRLAREAADEAKAAMDEAKGAADDAKAAIVDARDPTKLAAALTKAKAAKEKALELAARAKRIAEKANSAKAKLNEVAPSRPAP